MFARVAFESTLFLHGVPRASALPLAARLCGIVREEGAVPQIVYVENGVPRVAEDAQAFSSMVALPPERAPKLNSSNLGIALWSKRHGATSVSATMEIAAHAGIRWFATGGLGGVHPLRVEGTAVHLDVSSDLFAFTRFPVAVVASGVKSILDVAGTREALECLGIPVVGYRTDEFPAFYLRRADEQRSLPVDERFDDEASLSSFVHYETTRTGRGVLVVNPIAPEAELVRHQWETWLSIAESSAAVRKATGRGKTPALLGELHRVSGGKTLDANIRLIEDNARLAARLSFISRGYGDAP